MIRIVVPILLIGHGLVHLLGFVVPWQLATLEEMPYKTTLLAGTLDVGAVGIRDEQSEDRRVNRRRPGHRSRDTPGTGLRPLSA